MVIRHNRPALRPPSTVVGLLGIVLAVLLTGCSAGGSGQAPRQTGSTSATRSSPAQGGTATAASTEGVPSAAATRRPIETVPADVKPKGIDDPPQGKGMSRYTSQKIVWEDCPVKGVPSKQCATVLAPLDWDKPNGPALTLALARRPGTQSPRGDLFINPGGPGGSGTDFVDYFAAHGLEKHYNIIGWDPRGVGKSTPVRCLTSDEMEDYTAFDYSPDDDQEVTALTKINTDFGLACLRRSGELLEHISTADTVRDLDLLRQLSGERQLDYFGSSYGTSIGALYATMFPQNTGRMVLDGATSIGGAPEVSQTFGFDRTLGNFATWCAANKCSLGDSKAAVLAKIDQLLKGLDTRSIPGGRRDLTQALATTGLLYALYSPASMWPDLLAGLEQAVSGDGSALLRWADQYNQRDSDGDFGQFNDSFPAIKCLDSGDDGVAGAMKTWHKIEKAAPTLGPYIGPDLGCPTWPVKATDDVDVKIKYQDRPDILVLGTTGDPATPYEYAEHMHKALKASRLITLNGNGHLAYDQSKCVQAKVLSYLIDGTEPGRSSTCTDG